MRRSPPLRFLAIVLGGWAALRTAMIAPPWWTPPAGAAASPRPQRLARGGVAVAPKEAGPESLPESGGAAAAAATPIRPAPPLPGGHAATRLATAAGAGPERRVRGIAAVPFTALPRPPLVPPPAAGPRAPRRWSFSAWSFVRRGDSAPLASGGLLGGSQAGARLTFRLNRDRARPLALSARLSAPLRRPAGGDAALGLDWKPIGRLPVHVLGERRQSVGGEGRSAFGLTLYGGLYDAPLGPLRVDAYAQAGVVGARSLDLFADGSLRLSLPLGRNARAGAGAWAGGQPGVSRFDLGPQAALRLPVAGRAVTLAADWRLRVAGNARPGSGPTLTLATDF
ncbi:MAG TPA: hypothetical protein VF574_10395 [Allosphingosinicella sp.]|jgi:hypothetical protein